MRILFLLSKRKITTPEKEITEQSHTKRKGKRAMKGENPQLQGGEIKMSFLSSLSFGVIILMATFTWKGKRLPMQGRRPLYCTDPTTDSPSSSQMHTQREKVAGKYCYGRLIVMEKREREWTPAKKYCRLIQVGHAQDVRACVRASESKTYCKGKHNQTWLSDRIIFFFFGDVEKWLCSNFRCRRNIIYCKKRNLNEFAQREKNRKLFSRRHAQPVCTLRPILFSFLC